MDSGSGDREGRDEGHPADTRPGASRTAFLDARALIGCRHRLRMDAAHPEIVRGVAEDPGVRQRRDAAAAHRDKVRETLVADAPEAWVVIDPALRAGDRAEATLRACEQGAHRIWGGLLPQEPDTGRRGGAEILLRDLDRGGYIPVIVVNHKVTDPRRPEPADFHPVTSDLFRWDPRPDPARKLRQQPRDQQRLAHLYRMLQRRGLASPSLLGGVIGYHFDRILVHDVAPILADYDRRYADRIAVVRGELPTEPSKVPECRQCPWWTRGVDGPSCESWLIEHRDVSVVAPGSRADVLRGHGVRTIDDLAAWQGPDPQDWQHGPFDEAVVTARAWLAGAPLVRRFDRVRVRRADVEVDVDLESFQEFGAYLWGTLLDGVYRPFVTWDPLPTEDEGRSFGEFWTWLMTVRAQAVAAGKTFAAYCYSRTAEDKWLYESAKRFAGRPGVPTVEQVRAFVDGPEWVDMFQAVTDQFICPNGKGLKKIAPVAGFSWRDPEAGGEASMSWYRLAVGYDAPPDLSQRTRLFEYNEDDVRATWVLREWMAPKTPNPHCAELEVPALADFGDPPRVRSGDASAAGSAVRP
ncbi:TM0106 family RecB-like putative nuclease [Nocardia puris]|uniref:Putative RecB family nuclease n=1 Tax=Nocardia puris TaxID=208602 RepID=A0A366DNQ3_9NOCA|nr:TM0106 family RecB-like putative nuclease [Nocardia puris]MBF6365326.1 TM0106 family RecB-like putative nuclease [Nocardia puris]MBF6459728.1 TM0106 family RecB-like putative nuclease [Nocardia puris]RBO91727.1 putative RecB family nuclease [Nocardia puris]